MTHALNLVLPLKQDRVTRDAVDALAATFATEVQPAIDAALRESKLVHFARVVVIGYDYICVFTEYEGDHNEYTEFFRRKLTPVFAVIFALADGAPGAEDPAAFFNYSREKNVRSLGTAADDAVDMDGAAAGWLFSAYDHKGVEKIQAALARA